MKENYINAVLEMYMADKESTNVLEGLKKTLARKGHNRLYAPVLRGVLRVLESRGTEHSRVVVASHESYTKQKNAIESALRALGAEGSHEVIVDETIVGGFIAEANNTQLDKSYKTKLVSLYRNLTK